MRVLTADDFEEEPGPYTVISLVGHDTNEATYVNACEYAIVQLPSGEHVKVYREDVRQALTMAIIRSAQRGIQ